MNEWNQAGKVRNFGKCRKEQFEKMRADLGLTMSDAKLTLCTAFYTQANRDPLIGELRLLDRLASLPADPTATGFVRLDTNDAAMAETYADMMTKRRDLRPDAITPITVGEAFSLASAALAKGGKERIPSGVSAVLSDLPGQPLGNGCFGAVGSSAVLRISEENTTAGPVTVGDVFLLIRRGTLSPRAFRKTMRETIRDNRFLNALRGIVPIGERGVLPFLLQISTGLYIDLDRFGFGRNTSPEMLVGELSGDWLAILPKKNAEATLASIASAGMQGTMFAAVTTGTQTVIITSERKSLSLDSAFLRNLNVADPASVVLKDETERDAIAHLPCNERACRYLAEEQPTRETATVGNITVSAAAATLEKAPFRTALTTALAPVLTLAVSGADYTDARIAVDLEISRNANLGEVLAAILGVYRAQAELGIPSLTQHLRAKQTDRTDLAVFAVARDAVGIPSRFTKVGAGIYLVSVPTDARGVSDFRAFRAMLAELKAIAREKKILSAKILANEAVTDALRAMRGNGLAPCLTDFAVAADGALPLALLIESAEELPFTRIGTVTECPSRSAEEADPFCLPVGNDLVFRETPEAAILAAPNDGDAQIFADHLIAHGIVTTLCTTEEREFLSRAMLTANVVFVCGNVAWEEDARIAFARSVLERNGGTLISVGPEDTIPETIPHSFYSGGIPSLF